MRDLFSLRPALRMMALGVALALGAGAGAFAEARAQGQNAVSNSQLLEDFNFYVMVANVEMAGANARALLDRGVAPQQFVALVEDSATMRERFDRAYRRAVVMPELEEVAAALQNLYQRGLLERARDPREIQKNIGLLAGNPRAQILARERLSAAGEYAVPQLLGVLLARQDRALETEVSALLVLMGRQAVAPLSAALLSVDPATQETVARILGRIGYPSAVPFLAELHRTTPSEAVRAAAARAVQALGGSVSPDMDLSDLYRGLAEQYYREPRGLTSFPGEQHQLLWSFEPGIGLHPTAIASEVFHEAMAMRMAEKALRLDPSNQEAISLWIAANFSREIDTPEGYDNPAYGPGRRDAMYYAVAAGAETTQRVLARALEDRDTALARRAIEALTRSAGVSGLVGPQGVPLVEALTYPDRRVRFEAALALGRAKPREFFEGAERVVPTLAGMVTDGGAQYAVVVASEMTRQQELRSKVEALGYRVLPPGSSLEAVSASVADVSGVDLLVSDLTTERTVDLIDQSRRSPRLRATPILAFMSASGVAQYAGQFESDRLTQVIRPGVSDAQFREAVTQLTEQASGPPVSDDEARSYATAALLVLQELAIAGHGAAHSGPPALDIADAAVPLVTALGATSGTLRYQVADVLSYIGQQRAQAAIMDAAMEAAGGERLVLMSRMIDSARRFGNMLEQRHIRWLLEAAEDGSDEEATMAAALIGALNLPNAQLVPLILGG